MPTDTEPPGEKLRQSLEEQIATAEGLALAAELVGNADTIPVAMGAHVRAAAYAFRTGQRALELARDNPGAVAQVGLSSVHTIPHRWNTAPCWKGDATSMRDAVERAVIARANLTDAYLADANLARAYLTGANLVRANLTDADLVPIRDDFFAVLDAAPAEVAGLLKALHEGRVDGSTYSGSCACLVGTIANVRGVAYGSLGALAPDSSRPAERWFHGINEGDTPASNQVAKITEKWIGEWMTKQPSKCATEVSRG